MRPNKIIKKNESVQPSADAGSRRRFGRRKVLMIFSGAVSVVAVLALGAFLVWPGILEQRDQGEEASLEGREFVPDTTRSQTGTVKSINAETLVLDTGTDDLELAITDDTEYREEYTVHEADPDELIDGSRAGASRVDVTYDYETNEVITVWVL